MAASIPTRTARTATMKVRRRVYGVHSRGAASSARAKTLSAVWAGASRAMAGDDVDGVVVDGVVVRMVEWVVVEDDDDDEEEDEDDEDEVEEEDDAEDDEDEDDEAASGLEEGRSGVSSEGGTLEGGNGSEEDGDPVVVETAAVEAAEAEAADEGSSVGDDGVGDRTWCFGPTTSPSEEARMSTGPVSTPGVPEAGEDARRSPSGSWKCARSSSSLDSSASRAPALASPSDTARRRVGDGCAEHRDSRGPPGKRER